MVGTNPTVPEKGRRAERKSAREETVRIYETPVVDSYRKSVLNL